MSCVVTLWSKIVDVSDYRVIVLANGGCNNLLSSSDRDRPIEGGQLSNRPIGERFGGKGRSRCGAITRKRNCLGLVDICPDVVACVSRYPSTHGRISVTFVAGFEYTNHRDSFERKQEWRKALALDMRYGAVPMKDGAASTERLAGCN